ncbi:xanthine dehydrogenase family protein subunit M [Homoserinimonas sp. OAct 916]|uniref:FAD binding domain-containing protein n=1 Tax=Homoserinimonas sp. OAct 916 TaxID=2211450 RepID=UPI000DBEA2FA|nr:FAD binding domain-containing protein [Homoserinimonas sp. OAct 916]
MKLSPFTYCRPDSVAEAIELLAGDPASYPLAGGQSLMPAIALKERRADLLVDISRLDDLRGISFSGTSVTIGAAEPMWDLERSELIRTHLPLLTRALSTVAAAGIRSRATLGGSAGWADRTSQLPATLVALDATIVSSTRRIKAHEFFVGHGQTALNHDELVLRFEIPSASLGHHDLQVVRRTYITWPVAGAAAVGTDAGTIRVALFGAAPAPILIVTSDPADAAEQASDRAAPFDDEHATSTYRQRVIPVLARRAVANVLRVET